MATDFPSPEERLERGDLLFHPIAPFSLPQGDDLDFLLARRQRGLPKNVSYDPNSGRVSGHVRGGAAEEARLAELFAAFSAGVRAWLARALPRYAGGCEPDRASFRPLEEATRRLRPTARNDLLHVDAFPSRPARGRRILRVFANVNPAEPRVWATSEPFARLLARYGAGLPRAGLLEGVLRLVRPGRRSGYDAFMRRFHDYLKRSDDVQSRSPRRLWRFPPGSAWVAMTDACAYAELRGRFALEHSFFVAPHVLALPAESPAALLAAACGRVA